MEKPYLIIIRQIKNVVAENARDAVNKIENIMKTDPEYNYEWELEEPPYGTFKTTFINFDPINVTLEAEAD